MINKGKFFCTRMAASPELLTSYLYKEISFYYYSGNHPCELESINCQMNEVHSPNDCCQELNNIHPLTKGLHTLHQLLKRNLYTSQPLKLVARATRSSPSENAPIRRSQSSCLHISLMSVKALIIYVRSSLLICGSSHLKPWIF